MTRNCAVPCGKKLSVEHVHKRRGLFCCNDSARAAASVYCLILFASAVKRDRVENTIHKQAILLSSGYHLVALFRPASGWRSLTRLAALLVPTTQNGISPARIAAAKRLSRSVSFAAMAVGVISY
jgi:hypothetical protein